MGDDFAFLGVIAGSAVDNLAIGDPITRTRSRREPYGRERYRKRERGMPGGRYGIRYL